MKKTLREQIERIHTLTYGKKIIKEGFLDDLLGREVDEQDSVASKIDNSKKADAVGKDEQGKEVADPKLLEDFYNTFEKAAASGGLKQQSGGSMVYAKEVESMQIALVLLGYQLPQHGIDGLFGPETAASVQKFATENNVDLNSTGGAPKSGVTSDATTTNETYITVRQIHEAAKLVAQGGEIIGRPGQGTHNASDWQSRNAWDITGPIGSDVYSITTGTVDKVKKGNGQLVQSGVKKIYGDQISVKSSDGKPDMFYTHLETSLTPGSPVKEGDVIGKLISMDGIPSHVHVGVSTGDLSDLVDELPNAGGGGAGGGGAATGSGAAAGGAAVSDTAGRIALGRLGATATAAPTTGQTQSGATVNESSQELRSTLSKLGYKEKGSEIASGGEITDELSSIVSKILSDFKQSNPNVSVTVTGGNDKFHQGLNYKSKHTEGKAVDMVIDPFNNENANTFVTLLDKYKGQDSKFSYIDEYRHPSGAATAGHFHLQYGEGVANGGPSMVAAISATPEFLKALLEKVKGLNLTPEKLKEFIKKNVSSAGGGGIIDVKDWQGIVNTVIDNLEGGYYHPDMLQDGRVNDSRFGNSGETMFGMDRKAGGIEATGPAGQEFWKLIDAEGARNKWKNEYMLKDNPSLANKLRELAGQIMKPLFDQYSRRYLSPEAATIVSNSVPLTFHFAYATWNGPGWFQKFAKVLNNAVASGNTDPKALLDVAMENRVSTGNSLMDQVGNKVAKLTSRMPSSSDTMA